MNLLDCSTPTPALGHSVLPLPWPMFELQDGRSGSAIGDTASSSGLLPCSLDHPDCIAPQQYVAALGSRNAAANSAVSVT